MSCGNTKKISSGDKVFELYSESERFEARRDKKYLKNFSFFPHSLQADIWLSPELYCS
jgi:hypothetical protein